VLNALKILQFQGVQHGMGPPQNNRSCFKLQSRYFPENPVVSVMGLKLSQPSITIFPERPVVKKKQWTQVSETRGIEVNEAGGLTLTSG
jgi:hypothetical protein